MLFQSDEQDFYTLYVAKPDGGVETNETRVDDLVFHRLSLSKGPYQGHSAYLRCVVATLVYEHSIVRSYCTLWLFREKRSILRDKLEWLRFISIGYMYRGACIGREKERKPHELTDDHIRSSESKLRAFFISKTIIDKE